MWSSSSHPAFSNHAKLLLAILGILFFSLPARGEERLVLFCPDIPRKEAILVAAFQAGKEVVFFEDPQGNVTLRRESMTFEQALDLLLEGTGILWHEKNGVYYIGTPEEGTPEYVAMSDVETYESHFVTARDILSLHPEFVGKLLPVSPFRFLIAGPQKLRERIKNAIQALDHPREHVLLEAALFEATETQKEDLAFSFPDTVSFSLSPHPEREEKLEGVLRAEKDTERSSLRAMQQLLVLEGEWGEGWTGQRAYYVVEGNLRVIELGTGIRARPVCLGDGRIRVDLEVNVASTGRQDPLTVIQRAFSGSVVLEEGKTVPVTLVEERKEVIRARKLFESRTQNNPLPKEEEHLVLFVSARREHSGNLPSIAHIEGPPIAVQEEKRDTWKAEGFLEYRAPGFVGVGFCASFEETTSISGSFYQALDGRSFFGNLELSFLLEEDTLLGAQWKWTESAQGWVVFFEHHERGYFFRVGAGKAASHAVSVVSLGGQYTEGVLTLRRALTYAMSQETQSLRLDLEGQWAVRKNVALLVGYSTVLSRERTPFDDLQFEGLFVGLRITF